MMNNEGKEIPFLLKKENLYQENSDFIEYTILSNTNDGNWQTILIDNPNSTTIDKLLFEMKNAETDRSVRINGSNDKQKWFVVKDSFKFSVLQNENAANVFNYISFPYTDYKFYKVEIKTKNQQPINILRVGYKNVITKAPVFNEINGLTFTRKDSNKKTILQFTCVPSNRIDKLTFSISSPSLYKRIAYLHTEMPEDEYSNTTTSMSVKSYKRYSPSAETFEISSDKATQVETNSFLGYSKTATFKIEIQNDDNEPLTINSIKAYQLVSSITADLKKDNTYFLYFGDSLLNAPLYDIVYFESKISDSIPVLKSGNVLPKNTQQDEEYNGNADKYLVWIGLGIVGILLLFVISNMLKNMKKEEVNS